MPNQHHLVRLVKVTIGNTGKVGSWNNMDCIVSEENTAHVTDALSPPGDLCFSMHSLLHTTIPHNTIIPQGLSLSYFPSTLRTLHTFYTFLVVFFGACHGPRLIFVLQAGIGSYLGISYLLIIYFTISSYFVKDK